MLRWLTRFFLFGIIAAAVAFAVSKLMGKDEDFDDFDDIDSNFEFQETPVEIDVPADSTPSLGFASATADVSNYDSSFGTTATASPATYRATSDTTRLNDDQAGDGTTDDATQEGAQEAPADGGKLIDINGIGPAYEARLAAVGIESIAQLAEADAPTIAEQIDVIGGVTTIEDWIGQAKAYTEGKWRGEDAG